MKEGYLDFEEYIRQGEPDKKTKAFIWRTAIGLQAVDGLNTSDYLKETARRHIEGDINIDEVRALIKSYYQSKTEREPDDDKKQEADKVSANITKILSSETLDFSTRGYIALHRRIFEGVFKHAGKVRDYDISKKEWVLEYDSVFYLNWEDLKNIDYSPVYLERFFRNLLLGDGWDLRNRYLHIHPTAEWQEQPNLAAPTSTRTSTRASTRTSTRISSPVNALNPVSKLYTSNGNVIELVRVVGYEEMSIKQMMEINGLKHRQTFIDYHLEPSLKERFIRRKYPDRPNHPRQKYLLTVKGQALYQELKKGEMI